jgi:signal recognition particle subunit SEC65|tara:strand:+ start:194 stop:559 length:366 start_codon:yes stop_codon:yes gene_type:complete
MSKVVFAAYFDGFSRRKDRTVSMRFITQEKTSVEVMKIDEMLHQFGILYFRGEENMNPDEIEELDNIDLDLYDEPKSQSQRLRSVLFVLWKQEGEEGEFKKFYKQKTEEIIQHFKNKLEDE